MADIVYKSFKVDVATENINLATDTIKAMLVTSSYTPNSSHSKRSDVTGEVIGDGYTAGGQALANQSYVLSGDRGVLDADDLQWDLSTITARGAVLYKSRGGAASADELVGYLDFGSDKTSSNGPFDLEFNPAGILELD